MIKTIKIILVLMFSLFSSDFNKKKSKKRLCQYMISQLKILKEVKCH